MFHLLRTVVVMAIIAVTLQTDSSLDHGYLPNSIGNSTSFDIMGNDTHTDFMFEVSPATVSIFMDKQTAINVTYTIACDSTNKVYKLRLRINGNGVVQLVKSGQYNISCRDSNHTSSYTSKTGTLHTGVISVQLQAGLIGRAWLILETEDSNSTLLTDHGDSGTNKYNISTIANVTTSIDDDFYTKKYLIVVTREPRPIDKIFRILVFFFLVISTIGMGCKMEIDVVLSVLKKPIAPAIGFVCQYLCMPLVAFAVAKMIKFDGPAVGLGIFCSGICPGGGPSNIYTYLLGGDVSLSVTMTTISNIAALGMIPVWIFTLGQQFQDDKIQISIPYLDILQTLAMVILPLFLGIFIKYKFPKVAAKIMKVLKPVSFVTITIVLGFGIYANLYIFRLFTPSTFLAGCLLPYVGYILGGVAGLIFRQKWYRVKTIAIETGVQNTMVAYIMLLTALPAPDGDLAAVGPVASAVMTPIPLFVIALFYNIYLKCTDQDYDEVSRAEPVDDAKVTNGNAHKIRDMIFKRKRDKRNINGAKRDKEETEVELVDSSPSM